MWIKLYQSLFDVTITQTESTLNAGEGVAYQWHLNGEAIAGATSESFTPTESGNYSVEVTNAEGCTVLSEEFEFVYTSVFNYSQNFQLDIYPNPASEILNVFINSANISQNFELTIRNTYGQVVHIQSITFTSPMLLSIDVATFSSGVYQLSMVNKYFGVFKKFII